MWLPAVQGFRFGFATNSSSSHSIIFGYTPEETGLGDQTNRGYDSADFGWDGFVCASPERKRLYMLKQLQNKVRLNVAGAPSYGFGEEAVEKLLADFLGIEEPPDGYGIDHDSVCSFPHCRRERDKVHLGFAKAAIDYIADNPNIAILGGNDNEDDMWTFDYDDGDPLLPSSRGRIDTGGMLPYGVVSYDTGTGHWTAFSSHTGAKVRYHFGDKPVTYSTMPELVDLKITDYCDYGCKFCYQGSTTAGQHAPLRDLQGIIYDLCRAGVFEVALGGGETTQHPNFAELLDSCKVHGMTPNFTTFSLKGWEKNDKIVAAVLRNCGGFAVSNLKQAELDRVKAWNRNPKHSVKATLQIPCGAYSRKVVENALKFASDNYIAVTLLGYKTTKRGKDFPSEKYDWMLKFIKEQCNSNFRVGVDTQFVGQFGDQLKALAVDPRGTVGEEGAFSCYVDGVEGTLHKCSFEEGSVGIPIFEATQFGRSCTLHKMLQAHFPFAGKPAETTAP